MKYFLFLAFLFSCGKPSNSLVVSQQPLFIDEETQPFFDRFNDYASSLGIKPDYRNLVIRLTDESPKSNVLAVCISNGYNHREIVIYNSFWNTADDIQKEILLGHEFGHCCLNQDHRSDSIMNTYLLSNSYYIANYDELIKELFGVSDDSLEFIYMSY